MNKAIFIDKDGTLIENIPYNVDLEFVHLLPYVGEGLQIVQQLGYKIIIISNQSGIARGIFEEEEIIPMRLELHHLLGAFGVTIEGFYYCPHHPKGNVPKYSIDCNCRKPKPGLLTKAAIEHDIDVNQSWMIGDILHDVEAGNRSGCKTILIDNGSETEWQLSVTREPTFIAKNFKAATHIIFSREKENFHSLDRAKLKSSQAFWENQNHGKYR